MDRVRHRYLLDLLLVLSLSGGLLAMALWVSAASISLPCLVLPPTAVGLVAGLLVWVIVGAVVPTDSERRAVSAIQRS